MPLSNFMNKMKIDIYNSDNDIKSLYRPVKLKRHPTAHPAHCVPSCKHPTYAEEQIQLPLLSAEHIYRRQKQQISDKGWQKAHSVDVEVKINEEISPSGFGYSAVKLIVIRHTASLLP